MNMKQGILLLTILISLCMLFTPRALAFSGSVTNTYAIVTINSSDIANALPFYFGPPGPPGPAQANQCGVPSGWEAYATDSNGNEFSSGFQSIKQLTATESISQLRPFIYGIDISYIIFDSTGNCDWFPSTLEFNAFNSNNLSGLSFVPFSSLPTTFGPVVSPSVDSISVPTTIGINSSFSASSTFADATNTATHTASWNWGDGSSSVGTVTESNGMGSVTGSHTYTLVGSHTIILTVTNNGGLTGISQAVIAVTPANGLRGANLSGSNYSGANLSNQNISGSNLQNGTFNNTNFTNSNLSGSNGQNASFQNANFTNANLSGANMSGVKMQNADFTNAIITGTNFQNANLTNANMTGANLSGANFHGATIIGITWSDTTCPNGTNSNTHNNTCVGQGGGL